MSSVTRLVRRSVLSAMRKYTGNVKEAPERVILTFPKDIDGLFIQPDVLTPEIAIQIEHNRERMAYKWEYADEFTGNTKTFDPLGFYTCGRCNQADNDDCLLITPSAINRQAGSCGKFETICSGDPELRANRMPAAVANYSVAKNGIGYSCLRCPFARQTKWFDSKIRLFWCGLGASTVQPNACCTLNGAETV